MPLIEWKDEFKIGIPAVDFEHRQLIDSINDLHASLAGKPPRDAVTAFLGEIFAGISAHFALEEKEMREMKYDQYADHKASHEALLDEIRDIMDEVEADHADRYEGDLSERLNRWFTVHFSTFDARLHRFIQPKIRTRHPAP